MNTYLATIPGIASDVIEGPQTDDSGFVVVGTENFDSGTFSFPQQDEVSVPYIVVTHPDGRIIRFSTLRS